MTPDITVEEVADLARGMTYKFGIHGFPRGGSKAGIWGDPGMPPEKKRDTLRAFGRALVPYLRHDEVVCGPDMGVSVDDVQEIYTGAGVRNRRTGLFSRPHQGDPLAYHLTGLGVCCACQSAARVAGLDFSGSRILLEGFGQVGVGVARYAHARGARVVAVSTVKGAVYNPEGLDVPRLLELRRQHGDSCIDHVRGDKLPADELYFCPADILVPGARPHVITAENVGRVQSGIVVSAGNNSVTREADEMLSRRGSLSVPDFVANGGAIIASLVDFNGGTREQAFKAIEERISALTESVLREAIDRSSTPHSVATRRVKQLVLESRSRPRRSFEETMSEVRDLLGLSHAAGDHQRRG